MTTFQSNPQPRPAGVSTSPSGSHAPASHAPASNAPASNAPAGHVPTGQAAASQASGADSGHLVLRVAWLVDRSALSQAANAMRPAAATQSPGPARADDSIGSQMAAAKPGSANAGEVEITLDVRIKDLRFVAPSSSPSAYPATSADGRSQRGAVAFRVGGGSWTEVETPASVEISRAGTTTYVHVDCPGLIIASVPVDTRAQGERDQSPCAPAAAAGSAPSAGETLRGPTYIWAAGFEALGLEGGRYELSRARVLDKPEVW
ncbi:MAG: hypothetical protein SFZ23_09595 [Planctomycetota bacterium]|nr:hypothetical protein [Planctomycetota bacterium]